MILDIGVNWLYEKHHVKVSPQTLMNWLVSHGAREKVKPKFSRGMSRNLDANKGAVLKAFAKPGFSVKDGVNWLKADLNIEVSPQVLSVWLRKQGKKSNGRRGPAPRYEGVHA